MSLRFLPRLASQIRVPVDVALPVARASSVLTFVAVVDYLLVSFHPGVDSEVLVSLLDLVLI